MRERAKECTKGGRKGCSLAASLMLRNEGRLGALRWVRMRERGVGAWEHQQLPSTPGAAANDDDVTDWIPYACRQAAAVYDSPP